MDETYKNMTLEECLYHLFDGYGAKWGLDVGNDGLWFVPELVAIQSRDGLSSMDMVAVLTKVVQE